MSDAAYSVKKAWWLENALALGVALSFALFYLFFSVYAGLPFNSIFDGHFFFPILHVAYWSAFLVGHLLDFPPPIYAEMRTPVKNLLAAVAISAVFGILPVYYCGWAHITILKSIEISFPAHAAVNLVLALPYFVMRLVQRFRRGMRFDPARVAA